MPTGVGKLSNKLQEAKMNRLRLVIMLVLVFAVVVPAAPVVNASGGRPDLVVEFIFACRTEEFLHFGLIERNVGTEVAPAHTSVLYTTTWWDSCGSDCGRGPHPWEDAETYPVSAIAPGETVVVLLPIRILVPSPDTGFMGMSVWAMADDAAEGWGGYVSQYGGTIQELDELNNQTMLGGLLDCDRFKKSPGGEHQQLPATS